MSILPFARPMSVVAGILGLLVVFAGSMVAAQSPHSQHAHGAAPVAPGTARTSENPIADLDHVGRALMASDLPRLAVQRQGLDISLKHHATYRIYDYTGKGSLYGEPALHTWLSMLFVPSRWMDVGLFPIDHPQLATYLGRPFKSRIAPGEVDDTMIRRLELLAQYFDFLDHPHYRRLLKAPNHAVPLTRTQFAGIFDRAVQLRALEEALKAQGSKISTEQYRMLADRFARQDPARKGQMPEVPWGMLTAYGEEIPPLAEVIYTAYNGGVIPASQLVNHIGLAVAGRATNPADLQALVHEFGNLGVMRTDLKEATQRLRGRLFAWSQRTNDFAIVAIPGSLDGVWRVPFDVQRLHSPVVAPAMDLHNALVDAYHDGNPANLAAASTAMLALMREDPAYTSDARRLSSYYYTIVRPFLVSSLLYLAAAFFYAAAMRGAGLASRWYWIAGLTVLAAFAMQTLGITARVLIMQRAPVSNIWESIIWVSWGATVFAAWMEWRYRTIFTGLLMSLGGFFVLFSAWVLPNEMEQVQPLRAVLNSSWLTWHVLSITLSYAAFFLSAMFAFVLLMREALPSRLAAPMPTTQVLELFTYRAIQIGYPLLTWGIFSGAVWADHAWGRFWAWDPKETWSLITWFVYTIFLHMRLRHGLSGRALALASIAGFISVLITWLGVSYLPIFAGLHSYANG